MGWTEENISYTVDAVVLSTDGKVLLIKRGGEPYKGSWALPGGYVDPGETSRKAVARELREETSVVAMPVEFTMIGVFDEPDRDPRGRVVSAAYALEVLPNTEVTADDDAAEAQWWPLSALPSLAFDHAEIIREAIERVL